MVVFTQGMVRFGFWIARPLGPIMTLAVLLAGCSAPVAAPPAIEAPAESPAAASGTRGDNDVLVQYSLITALAAGDYDEGMPLRRLLKAGDFGIGTFDRLDGELILLDGELYQALADRTVRPADLSGGTPFATVTTFDEDGRIENLSAATLEDLDEQLDRKLPRRNAPYALRIDGDFRALMLRSVPAQKRPYQPLVEVVKHQTTWSREKTRGTLIGLRCPEWAGTINVAGYHWHFLSDDRQSGGHVLDCQFDGALLRYDECTTLTVHIPTSAAFEQYRADAVDDKDIDKIERQRAPGDGE